MGQPLLGREYRLVNDEVWLKGAGLAMGYWKDRQIVSLTNNQGWLPTKDKGVWQRANLLLSDDLIICLFLVAKIFSQKKLNK